MTERSARLLKEKALSDLRQLEERLNAVASESATRATIIDNLRQEMEQRQTAAQGEIFRHKDTIRQL